jgi:hypothetical protein
MSQQVATLGPQVIWSVAHHRGEASVGIIDPLHRPSSFPNRL